MYKIQNEQLTKDNQELQAQVVKLTEELSKVRLNQEM